MGEVWESAARLQSLVPDAVLVGGSAAVLYANHRVSFDHDHVIGDLRDRFDAVLEALESEPDWVTNRVTPGKIILGQLGDIETGVRQLIRTRPLEVATVPLLSGRDLVVPTAEEVLRVKGFLLVRRNQVRDYLDVAALADRYGISESAVVLRGIDDYYSDQRQMAGLGADGIASQVVRQLAEPRPRDQSTLRELPRYKGLAPRWQNWVDVRHTCERLALAIAEASA
jgi:hypothetical protein